MVMMQSLHIGENGLAEHERRRSPRGGANLHDTHIYTIELIMLLL